MATTAVEPTMPLERTAAPVTESGQPQAGRVMRPHAHASGAIASTRRKLRISAARHARSSSAGSD